MFSWNKSIVYTSPVFFRANITNSFKLTPILKTFFSTGNLVAASKFLRNVAENIESNLSVNTQTIRMANLVIGLLLSTKSVAHAIYARTIASRIFFFLSCLSESVAAVNCGLSLYDKCSTPIDSIIANTMVYSFYMAGKNLDDLHDHFNNVSVPVPSSIGTPRGGSQNYNHLPNFLFPTKVYHIELLNGTLLRMVKIINTNHSLLNE